MAIEVAPPKRDEPRTVRRRRGLDALLRLCGWGGAAALALIALAITIHTDTGSERLRQTYAAITNSAVAVAAVPSRTPEQEAETQALQAQVRALTADRDELAERMASLERHIEDMTGSIQRQAAQALQAAPVPQAMPPTPQAAPAPQAVPAPQAAPAPQAVPAPQATLAPQATPTPQAAPPPTLAAPNATAAAPPPAVAAQDTPPAPVTVASASTAAAEPRFDPLARPAMFDIAVSWPETPENNEQQAEPDDQAEPRMAVPLPPARFIAAPAEPPPLPRAEFGIELASAATIDQLRARWTTVKANYGPLLGGLQPVAVRERRPGSTTEYKLIAGPVPNLTTARQICARFIDAHTSCRPAKFNAENVVQR